jgi:hypothetical protein
MARRGRRYDIYLPITFNDGNPIPADHFMYVEDRLLAHFAGVTVHKREFPLRGVWRAEARVYHDQVVVLRSLDLRPRGSMRFIAQLKRDLLRDFDQLEILITESPLLVH